MKHVRLFENFDGKLNEEVYTVFNVTDGFFASPEVMTKQEAEQFVKDFPKRFQAQGYYLTSRRERINPADVRLRIDPVEAEDPEFETEYEAMENITMRGMLGNFKLKEGDRIKIMPGKMPKQYAVRMPNGITHINQEVIQDLIALGRLQPDEDANESLNISEKSEEDEWLSIVAKFYNEFYPEYPDEFEPSDYANDKEIESDQAKEKRKPGSQYDSDVPMEDALDTFKKNLTDDELAMIEISIDGGEYADAEEHDAQKNWSMIKVKRKDANEMRSKWEVSKDPLIHNGEKVDPKKIVRFIWEPRPNQDSQEFLAGRTENFGEIFSITEQRKGIYEVIFILKEEDYKSGFIAQMKAYFPGFGATDFR